MDVDQESRSIQREYLDFLDDERDDSTSSNKVKEMIRKGENRVIININDLRRKNPKRAARLLDEAVDEIIPFQRALHDFVSSTDAVYAKQFEEFFVGFEGSFGKNHTTPRSLVSSYLGSLVCVEGIVTKCSLVRPKVVKSVHYCPATKKTMERRYTDLTSLDAFPSTSAYPTKDDEGHPLQTEYGLSIYQDNQSFSIQEMPEKAPAGQLPRSVDIVADGDMVDKCKPGDRIQVIGIYRCLPGKRGGYTSGSFRSIVLANNIRVMTKEVTPLLTADDVAKIRQFSRQTKFNPFDMLAKSLAPSIHGHDYIKKAVLCMLVGGVEKILDNGTRLRGDINILLIGDPSTAKSQMLRYVLHTAPRAVATTGRGSTGVGLTAAVTTDKDSGERSLEAGAMVLADRGVVCIDEFDKMSDIDRTAIHEVMEQGQVTIAKAGIHAKLNARCSVLAAANPVYGRYDEYKPPMDNIGLQDSLLSRFDLIFIVLDEMDAERDRAISEHVVRMHRYRAPGEQDGEALPIAFGSDVLTTMDIDGGQSESDGKSSIFEKYDPVFHGKKSSAKKFGTKIVAMNFLKKFVHVVKLMKPRLTREACDLIAAEYSKLRAQDTTGTNKAKTQPVTARTLETMIRFSTAHAKVRTSKTITEVDAKFAIEMINFAYFKKVAVKETSLNDSEGEEGEEEEEEEREGEEESEETQESRRRSSRRRGAISGEQSEEFPPAKRTRPDISDDRLALFRSLVFQLFSTEHSQSVSMDTLKAKVENDFDDVEMQAALSAMQDANQLMVADDTVFLI
ncbi:DNA replication licensing factor MCM3-like [Oscarella lobularis]|uniref:DNA replication licensing factor MCM3-like n=1 Tax=Oscarella lobularis TaxID=121494 RepID=UPI0033134409